MAERSKESGGAANYVHLISGSHSVTVNNGSGLGSSILPTAAGRHGVIVTPLTSRPSPTPVNIPVRPQLISKVLVKAFTKGSKKDPKIYTLRNINPDEVSTVHKLECVIRDQLFDEISRSRFDIGYIQGSHTVTIRSKEDLLEVWSNIKKGSNIVLWCDGLKKKSTSKTPMSSDSSEDDDEEEIQETAKKKRKRAKNTEEEEPKKKRKKGEDKDEKVQTTIDQLTGKHGDKSYTPMQYRVWAEMYLGGVHPSLNNPPTSTMFNRAGGGVSVKRKTGQTSEVVSAISDLTSALTPKLIPSGSCSSTSSPAKMIDNRSKCYKQLADLKSLFENNVLSKEEYDTERSVILGVLKKLV